MPEYKPTILVVEDDPDDQELTKRALSRGRIQKNICVVSDGEQALNYLLRKGPYVDPLSSPRPSLILLDLNMPRIDGRDLLKKIRAAEETADIPVVVLTTSQQKEDVSRVYLLGCNSFLVKPNNPKEFVEMMTDFEHYWFEVSSLPDMLAVLEKQ